MSILHWVSCGHICLLRSWSTSSKCRFVYSLPHYSFVVCEICSDNPYFISMFFKVVERLLSESFLSFQVAPFLFSLLFLFLFFSAVSNLMTNSVLSLKYLRQKENPWNSPSYYSSVLKILSWFPFFSLPFRVFLCLCHIQCPCFFCCCT